jgi:hypothetical protein
MPTQIEILQRAKQAVQQLQDKLAEANGQLEEANEKIAAFERKELAQEIVQMKVAASVTEPADFFDEVDDLLNSNNDLSQVKLAMQHAGPGFTNAKLVSVADESRSKHASAESGPVPAHVKMARERLNQTLVELGVEVQD